MFTLVILLGIYDQLFPGGVGCGYCATVQNQRKTGSNAGKNLHYPQLNPVSSTVFHGRNGDRSMTQGACRKMVKGGIAAPAVARVHNQPRPSLGSSLALLLLSSP